ncbi:MAG: ThuA domain-containing protein [Clostridia bacterium]|nr:ThuA domain-containing protein [Clostridia bacterium]
MIRVTVWNEFFHEQHDETTKKVYPEGIHKAIAAFLGKEEDITVKTVVLDDENCGITEELLNETDVLLWWGHVRHNDVPDSVVDLVQHAVLKGMGIIFLHSGHHSKPFRRLMGTTANLCWRETNDLERVWVVKPYHPIAQGLPRYFDLNGEETYGEPFDIPEPDELVFIGWFSGGEVFRAGCCYRRGNGKIFYFQPGHETFPTYYNENVQTVLKNAVRWAKPDVRVSSLTAPHVRKIDDMKDGEDYVR